MLSIKERSYTRKEYCIVGRKNGHKVWYCGNGAPKLWSRGNSWVVCVHTIKMIMSYYRKAILSKDVKKINIIEITICTQETEKIRILNDMF